MVDDTLVDHGLRSTRRRRLGCVGHRCCHCQPGLAAPKPECREGHQMSGRFSRFGPFPMSFAPDNQLWLGRPLTASTACSGPCSTSASSSCLVRLFRTGTRFAATSVVVVQPDSTKHSTAHPVLPVMTNASPLSTICGPSRQRSHILPRLLLMLVIWLTCCTTIPPV